MLLGAGPGALICIVYQALSGRRVLAVLCPPHFCLSQGEQDFWLCLLGRSVIQSPVPLDPHSQGLLLPKGMGYNHFIRCWPLG